MPDRDWWSVLWPDPALVMRQIGVEPGMIVLDLCCGDGYFTAALAKRVAGRVFALDLDAGLIEQAKAEVAGVGATVRQWICADARDMGAVLPEPVDYVLLANTFHGVPDQASLARAVRSVTKPGGSFGLLNWHRQPREQTVVLGQPRGPKTEMRMAPDQVSTVVEPAGFRTSKIVELPPFHYGIVLEAID
ncbi:methyltransferase family protein [Bosea sp. BK604]|nr:class I SAM-dependent methyltransferase [Bosea sp. BK604]TCR62917.1 methyltransferase family protein [Bosea sp. BK604]